MTTSHFKGVQPSPFGGWSAIGENGSPMRQPGDKYSPRFKTSLKAHDYGLKREKQIAHAAIAKATDAP